jgi:organic radical activating enzyme
MKNIKEIKNLNELKKYSTIMITGGEPTLYIEKVNILLKEIKKTLPNTKLYYYTATFSNKFKELIFPYIDGIQFSLHENILNKDLEQFLELQKDLEQNIFKNISFRLYIDKNNNITIPINPKLWNKIKIEEWKSEDELLNETNKENNCLPKGEELLYFDIFKHIN